jgi:hypothetical protein
VTLDNRENVTLKRAKRREEEKRKQENNMDSKQTHNPPSQHA